MPFTPFHLGAGAVLKAAGGDRFSFMVFGGTQVLMDLEPGIMMLTGGTPLHGPSHTLGGSLVIGATAALIGKPVSELAFRMFGRKDMRISWPAAWASALLGSGTHILLDAVMHADMSPWAPLVGGNALLDLVSISTLHQLCLIAGLVGGLVVWIRSWRRSQNQEQSRPSRIPGTGGTRE